MNKYRKGKNLESESKADDTELKPECGGEDAENGQVSENCIGVKDLAVKDCRDDGDSLQDSFLEFLDGIRTPEQASPKHSYEFPVFDSTTPFNLCHGLQEQTFPPSGTTVTLTKFVEVMGKWWIH